MLMEKKFPMKVQVLRFVVLALLRGFVGEMVEKKLFVRKNVS